MTGPLLSPLLSWLLWGGLLVVGALALRSMATRGWYCRLDHCHPTALDADLCDDSSPTKTHTRRPDDV